MILEVEFKGTKILAEPIERLSNGNWKMESRSHHPRFTYGTVIEVDGNAVSGAALGTIGDVATAALKEMKDTVPMADNEIDGLMGVTSVMDELKALAGDAMKKFRGSADNLKVAVANTHKAAEQLDNAAKAIHDGLGIKTNGGPA